jgi:hypothetical protein
MGGSLSWKTLSGHIKDGQISKSILLQRQPGVQAVYTSHLENVDEKYATRADYIKIHSLKWRPFIGADGKIFAAKHSGSRELFLEPNIFPYHLRKGLRHFVLWSETPVDSDKILNIVSGQTGAKHVLWWVNHSDNRSVLDLWHAQVIFK